jgi:flavin-binding protein dodecin
LQDTATERASDNCVARAVESYMDVELFGRSQSSGVLYLCEFHKFAVASRLKVAVRIEHIPNAAGNACSEVSAHFSEHYRRVMFHIAVTHAVANREFRRCTARTR